MEESARDGIEGREHGAGSQEPVRRAGETPKHQIATQQPAVAERSVPSGR
jgi:hypothetical protein